ncbi:aspartate kinase [Caldisericum exile]|uniref:Bifunctional aspartokinase/homoserine dehydrogenase n=1 Tax=Caldisericum exile (strain DSM 21853 / NBRC 104410 / AZM16c01) TaxID=511051 RepID=A0A7U6GDZ8_CALEA|nr:aspartate kinase [Caldisericum exile]BAL80663.1 bifunctional aspartokinase/homoserine dehydrogenase [Caldisericum exile AZM16c01]
MLVLKFGGTSVGNAKAIKQVYEIVKNIPESKIVVVSAMSGITDSLIKAGNLAVSGNEGFKDVLDAIRKKHNDTSVELFGGTLESVNELLSELEQILFAVFKLRELSDKANALIQSFGERLNARVVSKYFQSMGLKSAPIDATTFLITTPDFLDANPMYEESKKRAEKIFGRYLREGFTPVVTGYIGATFDSSITTLGRGGSDFSATILGRILDAREVWIYTDVNGVLTADPKIVHDAKTIEKLSYAEVRELSYFGAKVMHSKSLIPAMEKHIPIRVLNTFDPNGPHTLISDETAFLGPKAVTSIKDIALVSVEGKGMQGLKGVSKRIFDVASKENVNIIMIAQSSSEQTVDLFVKDSDVDIFVKGLEKEFERELQLELIDKISSKRNLSIISIVGDGLNNDEALHKEIFRISYGYGFKILSIVQGSSENSLSFVVKRGDVSKSINALHSELGLAKPNTKTINIFQFGVGSVGKELIKLIKENEFHFEKDLHLRLRYVGLARSGSFAKGDEVDAHILNWDFNFKNTGLPLNYIITLPKNTVIVDVTNSDTIGMDLLELLSLGYNVVTSNKKNLATDYQTFKKFTTEKGKFLFETTVGASLPIIKVIRDFINSGDEVYKIVALPSGTLSFIFTLVNRGASLKDSILKAVELGYTEPNPVDDLVGMDLLRKGKILSYVIGKDFKENDIEFECFTKAKTLDEFFEDDLLNFEKRIKELSKNGVVYPVVEIEDKLRIRLKSFPKDSTFATLKEGENIFEIYLKNFSGIPITIRGLGAGLRITAEGVLQDILSLEAYI